MLAVAIAAVALLVYVWSEDVGVVGIAGIGIVGLLVLGMAVLAGLYLRHQAPKATRWLLACWTPGVVAVAGAIAAYLAVLSASYVADSDATETTKIAAALATATLAAVGTHVNSWLPEHLSPWLARKLLWPHYSKNHFPCLPKAELEKGANAWRALDAARTDDALWRGSDLENLLSTIKDAADAGQTAQHHGWQCAG